MIVNADSAQIYRDLPILSAAPTAQDRERAEHRLYGVRDGDEPCSAADWSAMAKREIADVHASGRIPILAGGTGLYIRTLLDGIAPVPPIDPEIRRQVREAPVEANRARLAGADPEASARLNPADTARIARALEVVLSTGRPIAQWQEQREGGIVADVLLKPLVLLPPRAWLYERCNARFEAMIDNGAVEEVKRLLARGLDPSLPVVRTLGLNAIEALLAGEISRDEAIARGQQATRNYAKRQYTWFAHQPPAGWPRWTQKLDSRAMGEALALLHPSA